MAPPKAKSYYVHEGEDVVLDMLLPVEAYDRVVHRQQDLDVVVVLPGMTPLALCVPQPLRHQLQGVGEVAHPHAGHWARHGGQKKKEPLRGPDTMVTLQKNLN